MGRKRRGRGLPFTYSHSVKKHLLDVMERCSIEIITITIFG
jgi:hypothetical protein